eukprot:411597-Rhodomonas_salina.1
MKETDAAKKPPSSSTPHTPHTRAAARTEDTGSSKGGGMSALLSPRSTASKAFSYCATGQSGGEPPVSPLVVGCGEESGAKSHLRRDTRAELPVKSH